MDGTSEIAALRAELLECQLRQQERRASFDDSIDSLFRLRQRANALLQDGLGLPDPGLIAANDFTDLDLYFTRFVRILDEAIGSAEARIDPDVRRSTSAGPSRPMPLTPPDIARRPSRKGLAIGIVIATIALGALASWRSDSPDLSEMVVANRTASQFVPPRELQALPSSPDATLLLFVHGVFGDALTTWRASGRGLFDFVTEMPEFAGKYDVFAFGFPSSMVGTGSFSVPEAARSLLRDVRYYEMASKYRRVVIVAHSMGGLVAIEALTTYAELKARVPLIVAYGTPYDGAQLANIGQHFLANPALRDMMLRDGNSLLASMANRWKQANIDAGSVTRVLCAYEKQPIVGLGLVVPESASSSLCSEPSDPIGDNHIGMVKASSATHDSVKVLVNALRSLPPLQTPVKPVPANATPPAPAAPPTPVTEWRSEGTTLEEITTGNHHCPDPGKGIFTCRGEPTRTNYRLRVSVGVGRRLSNPVLECVDGPCPFSSRSFIRVVDDGRLAEASFDVWSMPTRWRLTADVERLFIK